MEIPREPPHFGSGHFCAGCPWAMLFHWGCIVDGNVRKVPEPKIPNKKTELQQNQPVK